MTSTEGSCGGSRSYPLMTEALQGVNAAEAVVLHMLNAHVAASVH